MVVLTALYLLAAQLVAFLAWCGYDAYRSFTDGDSGVTGNGSRVIALDIERIEWGPIDDHGDRWRLLYGLLRRHGEVEEDVTAPSYAPIDINERIAVFGPAFGGGEYLERKPLIETPVAVRLKAHKHLAKLVSKLGTLVNAQPVAARIADDDISQALINARRQIPW